MSETNSPNAIGWPRYAVLWLALAVCAVSQWYIFQGEQWFWASWGLGLGALVAAWALGRPEPLRVFEATDPLPAEPSRAYRAIGWLATLVGLAAAATGAVLLSQAWLHYFGQGFALVGVGVLLGSLGLAIVDRPWRRSLAAVTWTATERWLFLGILALGLFLRFYRYDYFPPPDGVCAVEEPQSGQGALLILNGSRPWEFMLDRWLTLFGMTTFGHSFTAIRIPFTVMSWITIIPLYLLLRELVSRPAALFATLLFAFCRWHLMYARLSHAIFGPTLPIILFALYFSVRAYKRGGLAPYPAIGLLTGLTLFAYAGYRGTPAFIALFFAISLAHHLWNYRWAAVEAVRRAAGRALAVQVAGGVLLLACAAAVLVPLYFQLTLNPTYFVEAAIRATDNNSYYTDNPDLYWLQRVRRIQETAMMFNHFGDGSPTFNLPGAPQLDPVSGLLFTVGLAYCSIWALYRFQGYFAAYFIVLLGFGTVFVHNFDIRRLQGIIPLIFILVAFVADRFGQATVQRLGGRGRGLVAALAGVLIGLSFYDNYRVYFVEMMNNKGVRQSFHNAYTIGISYLQRLPDNAYVQMVGEHANFFSPSDFEWVRGERVPGVQSNDRWPLFAGEQRAWSGRDLHILIQETFYEAPEIAELIRWRYPEVVCDPYEHPDQHPYARYFACRIGFNQLQGKPTVGGIRARYYRQGADTPFLERDEPAISYALLPDECRVPRLEGKPKCRVEWEGEWIVPKDGEYTLVGEIRRGELQVMVDDIALHIPGYAAEDQDQTISRTVTLRAGPHRVVARARYGNPEFVGARLRYRETSGGPLHLMRFATAGH